MMTCYKSSFQECITITVLKIERTRNQPPFCLLQLQEKRGIPPPPVGLSWDSPHPPQESVRTDGRTDGRMDVRWRQNQNFSDQQVTKFAYPWCSASSAIKTLVSYLAWCMQCFHILSFNCQGLSNILGSLAVRLNELETTVILMKQQNITHSEVLKWVISLGCHRVRMLTNNTNCHYQSSQKFILAFYWGYSKERILGASKHLH